MAWKSATTQSRPSKPSHRPFTPHAYQVKAADFLVNNGAAALFADMGTGKSAAALAAFSALKKAGVASKLLIIAPRRTCQLTWWQESQVWTDFRHLKFAWLHDSRAPWDIDGSPRKKEKELLVDADIYLINPEGVAWLYKKFYDHKTKRAKLPFDTICVDESTAFKNYRAKRSKILLKLTEKTPRIWLMTGTPMPNGYDDLFGQILLLDGGASLGRFYTHYRDKYFVPDDYMGYSYKLKPGAAEEIENQIAPLVLRIDADDWLDMPELIDNPIKIRLDDLARGLYDELKKEMLISVPDGSITAANAAALYSKLAQLANGAIYMEAEVGQPRRVVHVHDAKLDALDDLLDQMGGAPLLLAYEFNHDLDRLKAWWTKRTKKELRYLGKGVTDRQVAEIERDWNANQIPLLAVHPQCLHPDTLVLTECRGWVRIVDVRDEERVHDGLAFVNHGGCKLSGFRETVDFFGVRMTPEHRVLVGGRWIEAQHVPNTRGSRRAAQYPNEEDVGGPRDVSELWAQRGYSFTERAARQQRRPEALHTLPPRGFPRYVRNPAIQLVARDARTTTQSQGEKLQILRWTTDILFARVAHIRRVLERHVRGVCRQPDARAGRCERRLLRPELSLGHERRAAGQQEKQQADLLQGVADTLSKVLQGCWRVARGYNPIFEQLLDSRGGAASVQPKRLPEGAKVPVYDLVACGPRSRFLVKNALGEQFVVHNSSGHGLNFQKGGAQHVCWFSATWNFELYDQLIHRILRQGNTSAHVVNHLLLVENSIDELKYAALAEKDMTQERFLQALNTAFDFDTIPTDAAASQTKETEIMAFEKLKHKAAALAPQAAEPKAAVRPKGWGKPAAEPVEAEEVPQAEAIQNKLRGRATQPAEAEEIEAPVDAAAAFSPELQAKLSGEEVVETKPAKPAKTRRAPDKGAEDSAPAPISHRSISVSVEIGFDADSNPVPRINATGSLTGAFDAKEAVEVAELAAHAAEAATNKIIEAIG